MPTCPSARCHGIRLYARDAAVDNDVAAHVQLDQSAFASGSGIADAAAIAAGATSAAHAAGGAVATITRADQSGSYVSWRITTIGEYDTKVLNFKLCDL